MRQQLLLLPDTQAARGLKSRPLEAIYQEAAQLVANGVREISLVAQDTGSYGRDLYGKPSLHLVIKRLATLLISSGCGSCTFIQPQ